MGIDFNAARFFVAVVEQGSFSGAARTLKSPLSTVSRKVGELEESLELRLLERSTRNLRVTDAGELFYEHAKRGIDEADSGVLALKNQREELKGKLRISLPVNFDSWWPIINAFSDRHPKVDLEILSMHGNIDFINDGIDVAFMVVPVCNPNYIVRELAAPERALYVSPEYIELNGAPETPEDLAHHKCLSIGDVKDEVVWLINGQTYTIQPAIKATDFRLLKYLTIQGRGVANMPLSICGLDVEEGRLVRLFDADDGKGVVLKLVYPRRRLLSTITRAYIEFCMEWVETNEDWNTSVFMK